MFAGYKTYIVAAVAVISAVASYLVGDASVADTAQLVLTAVLGATVRHGIASK
jgi:uncharacterized membrane-anchored protein